jgi:hypothetical protein
VRILTFLLHCWRNTYELSRFVGQTCRAGMVVAPLMLISLAFPIWGYSKGGPRVPYQELWASGFAPVVASTFLLLALGSWGAAARAKSSRWALVIYPIVNSLGAFYSPRMSEGASLALLIGVFFALVAYVCLFHLAGAKVWYGTARA